jgi:type 1 glutamine amidotransferase
VIPKKAGLRPLVPPVHSTLSNPQKFMKLLPSLLLCAGLFTASTQAQSPKPIRILLITGGCCHDYAKQKDILKEGIEKRLNAEVVQVHTDDKSVKPPLAIYGNPEYAKGFDLVIHDECAAGINDEAVVRGVLKPHDEGTPGVNLHCAMHCYRIGNAGDPVELGTPHGLWFEYLGLQSTGHGPQEPIAITHIDKNAPLSKNLPDWSTVKEELYNNIRVFDTATPVARGKQITKAKDGTEKENDVVVAWTNMHKSKTRVFSTTVGHNNATVEDDRYLDLVTRGVLWATDKLNPDGTAKAGAAK